MQGSEDRAWAELRDTAGAQGGQEEDPDGADDPHIPSGAEGPRLRVQSADLGIHSAQ